MNYLKAHFDFLKGQNIKIEPYYMKYFDLLKLTTGIQVNSSFSTQVDMLVDNIDVNKYDKISLHEEYFSTFLLDPNSNINKWLFQKSSADDMN